MSFSLFSPLGFAAGLVALAGVLYLLQRLRVRHREVDVATTLFWHEAVHEARARVLVQRFRHPWAYALVLAIAALLWSAVGAPERRGAGAHRYLFALDASAAMSRDGHVEGALARLRELLDEVPRDAREVVLCGAYPATLLAPGEEALLLDERLAQLADDEALLPEAAPPSVLRVLEAAARSDARPTTALVLSAAPLDAERLALLPASFEVRRVAYAPTAAAAPSTGVTALGIAEARSGAWDRVDVLVEVAADGVEPPAPNLAVDGAPVAQALTRRALGPGLAQFVVRDLPARGGTLRAQLPLGSSPAFVASAALVLPDREPLRVALAPGLAPLLGEALASDPALRLVEEGAEVVVRRADDALGAGLPALVVTTRDAAPAFRVRYAGDDDAEEVLRQAMGALALDQIDTTALAEESAAAIELAVEPGDAREVGVWEELLGPAYDLRDSRAFPLFLAGSLRWLAARAELVPWIAAGETPIAARVLTKGPDVRLEPLGAAAVLPWSGPYVTADGARLEASVLARDAVLAGAPAEDAYDDAPGAASDPVTWLLLAALALLVFEWRQVRTGRMP
ncbi:MAG: BatA domain-containing protein [Planctomycetes bacterium]|nr:BatA domain-containing protein [Planctomycetota bacterium]